MTAVDELFEVHPFASARSVAATAFSLEIEAKSFRTSATTFRRGVGRVDRYSQNGVSNEFREIIEISIPARKRFCPDPKYPSCCPNGVKNNRLDVDRTSLVSNPVFGQPTTINDYVNRSGGTGSKSLIFQSNDENKNGNLIFICV